ncbi:hypothetical protein [Pseudemcibacter aquimaris]|uniref:hypothetical protein n=1 Tax=Pseudemcibacter aquimaris TaxID=2857064 RepID=UPI002011DFC6|nr:hypothetical protein [Pseudemcibacter aquimaris]MCC3861263.1 hypothetical protein [Pseudemcibacter aquimaris]WDU58037.1 hypothetical protein KW060_12635 [Pseudemcibacter aquimaris]
MMITNALIFIMYFLVSASGLLLLKLSDGELISAKGIGGLFLYAVGFLIWYVVLSRINLSAAFPIAAGGLIISTQLVGYFFLKEYISMSHIAGILVIILGIALITIGDKPV